MLKEFTLLYVEDEKSTQEEMKELLQDELKEFYQAYNGEEGLKIYKEKKPDIIISDVVMPTLDGLKMSQKIKDIDPDQLIMFVSGLYDIDIIKKSIDLNIDGYINKPITNIENFIKQIYDKLSILQYKKLKKKEKDLKLFLTLIKEVSHHWKQPLSAISMISSTLTVKSEHNIEITKRDIQNFTVITSIVSELSDVFNKIEQIDPEANSLDDLLSIIKVSNPIYTRKNNE